VVGVHGIKLELHNLPDSSLEVGEVLWKLGVSVTLSRRQGVPVQFDERGELLKKIRLDAQKENGDVTLGLVDVTSRGGNLRRRRRRRRSRRNSRSSCALVQNLLHGGDVVPDDIPKQRSIVDFILMAEPELNSSAFVKSATGP
jgi:hypothetical protein